MRMPDVTTCGVETCSYNKNRRCHAMAITIGGNGCPECDTLSKKKIEAGDPKTLAGVGACKIASCQHNERLVCTADNVSIGRFADSAACTTYERRA